MPDTLTHPRPSTQARPEVEPMTFDQFICRPDERKADLIDGYLTDDMPTDAHEELFRFMITLMGLYARKRDLGIVRGSRTPVHIGKRRAFEPDILFIRKERAHIIQTLYVSEAPDVAVEIVSPSSVRRDYKTKRMGYEQMGTAEYWLIDPLDHHARFFRLGVDGLFADVSPADGESFESQALPGFRLTPADLFADPLPDELDLLTDLLA
jgi:Uma2 family endonuclease